MGKKKPFPPYHEAQLIVLKKGIKNIKEYDSSYKELGLPSSPERYYANNGWINWSTFLCKSKKEFPSYEEAKRMILERGIKSSIEYHSVCKELGLPSQANLFYKDKGWVSWFDYLGKTFPTYDEAQRIVQEKGIQSCSEYRLCFKELGLPSHPNEAYIENGWINWQIFFGKATKEFPTYEEAKRIVKEKGIKNAKDYFLSSKSAGLPSAPHIYYKDVGWTSWSDFLDKPLRVSPGDREYNLFKRLAINPVLLNDAPLKVIYIFFSKFREISEDVSSLLGTSSYEERLNWVKEQLNSLKDGSPSKIKTSDEPHDELSAMESLIEDNDDVRNSLSEEESEKFKTIWENYVHGVINRELISENDD